MSNEKWLTQFQRGSTIASIVFGSILLILILVLMVLLPSPSDFQLAVARVIVALDAAFLAVFFVGGIIIRGNLLGVTVSAGAGFALFVLIMFVYDPFPAPSDLWTVEGTIEGLGRMTPILSIQPPDQRTFPDGSFTIERIPFPRQANTTSALLVQLDGHDTVTVHLTGRLAQEYHVSLDNKDRKITIQDPIQLKKTGQVYDPGRGQTPTPLGTP